MAYGDVYAVGGQVLGAGALSGVTGTLLEGSGDIQADPQYLDRPGLPSDYVQSGLGPADTSLLFKTTSETATNALLAALDFPTGDTSLALQVYRGSNASPVLCAADVAIKQLRPGPGGVEALVTRRDQVWRAAAESGLASGSVAVGSSKAVTVVNTGQVRVPPIFILGWTVQRASFSSAAGWRFRRQVTITNDSDEGWHDELVTVVATDTDAWVAATEAQADGDDVRIWLNGRDLPRTLTCFNTDLTQIHFLVTIPAGESVTYDIVYGNSAATAPLTLSTRTGTRKTYAAPDLEGSSGTATAGTTTTLTDGGKSWETDRWKGGWIGLVGGTGSTRWRRIASNTGTVITFNRAVNTAPDATTRYVIFMSGVFYDGGRVTGGISATAIQDNAHTRKWGTNQLIGATVTFVGGSGATPATQTVTANTADTLTLSPGFSVNPGVGDSYNIQVQGVYGYVVDTALTETLHRGVYRENKQYAPPTRTWPNGDTPMGMQVETRLPNNDDYACNPAYNTGSGGGHAANYWPLPRATRRAEQDGRLAGEGVGDGWSLFTAVGLQGWYFDYTALNINGVGLIAFSAMDAGGEDWQDLVTDTTTYAVLTAVAAQHIDLASYDYPSRIGWFVLPADGEEIPSSAASTDKVEIRTNDAFQVFLNNSNYGDLASSIYSLGSKVECYELVCTLRIGGGADGAEEPPYDLVSIGGNGHRVMLETGQTLVVNTDPSPGLPLFGIYDGAVLVQAAAWAGLIRRYVVGEDGTTVALQSREFSPIRPALNLVSNGYFGSDASGWTMVASAGVTAAKNRVATPDAGDGIGTGSMEIDITGAPAGAWTVTLTTPQITVVPGQNYPVGFAYRATNIGSSLSVDLTGAWEGGVGADPDTVLGGAPAAINTWYYDADDEVTFKLEPGMFSPYSSTDTLDLEIVVSGSGAYVGKVYLDQITVGVPNVHMSQTDGGTATLDVAWVAGYLR